MHDPSARTGSRPKSEKSVDLALTGEVIWRYIRRTKGEITRDALNPMPTAAALRLEIEHALERKFPAALTPAPRAIYEVAATGIRAVDELLHGGLPVGAISELTGAASSGRTSLALQFVAQRTAEERACAWVDVSGCVRSGVGRGEWGAAEAGCCGCAAGIEVAR